MRFGAAMASPFMLVGRQESKETGIVLSVNVIKLCSVFHLSGGHVA